jgi:2-succinyl-6-hydroxy-2,4-cyclohexadiene-1-carboxylate synthase
MQAARAEHTPEGLASSLRQFGQGNCPNLWPQLGSLTLPVLVLTGALDRKYTQIAERIGARSGSNTQVRQLPEAGHMPFLEQAEPSAESIQSFLRKSLG